MTSALGNMFAMPGYADQETPDSHTVEVSASASFGSLNASGTLKVAWFIIVASLAALWLMGYSFK